MNWKVRWRRIFMLAGLASLVIIYAFLWARMISSKTERVGSDFIGLYTGARLAQSTGYMSMYDIESQQKIQAELVGFSFHPEQTGYFTHPPFLIPLVRLITNNDYAVSLTGWSVILLGFNGLNVFLLLRILPKNTFTKSERWLLAASAFLFFPTFSGLMNGQDIAILLFGTTIWMLQIFNDKPFSAGLGLGLAAIRPQLALMFSIPFLARHRKVFAGFAISGFALALFSLALIGMDGLSDYQHIVQVVEAGMWDHPHAKDMPTISGFIRRSVENVDQDLFRSLTWGGFLAGVTMLVIWWRKSPQIEEKQIGLLVLLGLVFVPYAHYHELSLLLIPIFCLIRIWAREKLVPTQTLVLLPLLASLLLLIGFSGTGIFKYATVYIVMIANGYFLLFTGKRMQPYDGE